MGTETKEVMESPISFALRWIFIFYMVYTCYQETGLFTSLLFIFIFIQMDIHAYAIRKLLNIHIRRIKWEKWKENHLSNP